MKYIKLNWAEGWDSKQVLLSVIQTAQEGISYSEIKKRIRIIDVIDGIKPEQVEIKLEDADWEVLKATIEKFKFGAATKELDRTLSAVMEASDGSHRVSRPAGDTSVSEERLSDRGGLDTGHPNGRDVDKDYPGNKYVDGSGAAGDYVDR